MYLCSEKFYHLRFILDVVIIGGDLVDGKVDQLSSAVESLEWIKSEYGTYFVTGKVTVPGPFIKVIKH